MVVHLALKELVVRGSFRLVGPHGSLANLPTPSSKGLDYFGCDGESEGYANKDKQRLVYGVSERQLSPDCYREYIVSATFQQNKATVYRIDLLASPSLVAASAGITSLLVSSMAGIV